MKYWEYIDNLNYACHYSEKNLKFCFCRKIQWAWIWANFGRCWRTERPERYELELQSVRYRLGDWTTATGKIRSFLLVSGSYWKPDIMYNILQMGWICKIILQINEVFINLNIFVCQWIHLFNFFTYTW